MKYKCNHTRSGLTLHIHTKDGQTILSGDEALVVACREYLESFKDSYHIEGDVQQMRKLYGEDLVIKNGSVYSVDTNNPIFISDFLVPELTTMGYSCTKVE